MSTVSLAWRANRMCETSATTCDWIAMQRKSTVIVFNKLEGILHLNTYAGGRKLAYNTLCIMQYMIIPRTTHWGTLFFFLVAIQVAITKYQIGYPEDIRLIICTWKLVAAAIASTNWGDANCGRMPSSRPVAVESAGPAV